MKTVTKVVSAALLAAAVTVTNAAEIKWSGAAQYRGRLDIKMGKDASGNDKDAELNRSNKYAWKLGMKTSINENLGFGFQVENGSGYDATNTVAGNAKFTNGAIKVSQAYLGVKKGGFHFNGGIIPVKGNTALTLSANIEDGNVGDLHMSNSWGVLRASSQTGVELGYKISDAFSFNVLAATLSTDGKFVSGEEKEGAGVVDSLNEKDDIRFSLNTPIKLGAATLTPALDVRSGVLDSWTSLAASGGLDFKVKAGDNVTIGAGVAVAGYGVGDKAMGILALVKPTFKLSDKFDLTTGFSYGNGKKRAEETASKDATAYSTILGDFKFGIKPIKNFTVMPRVRTWVKFNSDEDNDTFTTHLRPEILFIGKF